MTVRLTLCASAFPRPTHHRAKNFIEERQRRKKQPMLIRHTQRTIKSRDRETIRQREIAFVSRKNYALTNIFIDVALLVRRADFHRSLNPTQLNSQRTSISIERNVIFFSLSNFNEIK